MTDRAKPLGGTVPEDAFDVAVERLSRDVVRSRRKREVRARTVSVKRMTKRELLVGAELYPAEPSTRPQTRGECEFIQRPCPYVSCRYHLYLDVSHRTGAIKLNFPDLEPDEMAESCCLDVADREGATLEEVGAAINTTRERVRQIETLALARLKRRTEIAAEIEHEQTTRRPVRVLPEVEP